MLFKLPIVRALHIEAICKGILLTFYSSMWYILYPLLFNDDADIGLVVYANASRWFSKGQQEETALTALSWAAVMRALLTPFEQDLCVWPPLNRQEPNNLLPHEAHLFSFLCGYEQSNDFHSCHIRELTWILIIANVVGVGMATVEPTCTLTLNIACVDRSPVSRSVPLEKYRFSM